MTNTTNTHKQQMQTQKKDVDRRIKHANTKKGLVLVLTGHGKGKSSSAFGMLARSLGHGMRCGVVQFIKGQFVTGEDRFFRRFPDQVEFHVMGEGYTWETQNRERDIEVAKKAWGKAAHLLSNPDIDLIILDELNIVLDLKYLDIERVIKNICARPAMQHVVITGRSAPPALIEIADTVSEINSIKHAFDAGIQAQKGIEL